MAMIEEKVASGHALLPCNQITASVPPILTMRLCTQKCSATADPATSPNFSRAPFAVTDTVKTIPIAMAHIGIMNVQKDGTPKT